MESKIMQIFYGNDCLPYKDIERVVHYPIVGSAFQGASQTTEIHFYIDRIGGIDSTWVAVAKLPNGKIGSKVLESHLDFSNNEHYVSLPLSSFYTQAKGDLYISLQGYDGGVDVSYDDDTEIYSIVGTPVIQATGSVKIAINYATQPVGSDELEELTLQGLLAAIGGKLNKNSGLYLKVMPIHLLNTDSYYNDYIRKNDIVFDTVYHKFYKITEDDPAYEYQMIDLVFDGIELNDYLKVQSFADIISVGGEDEQTLVEYIAAQIAALSDEIDTKLGTKVSKVSTANRVYGTDNSGEQTDIPVDYGSNFGGKVVRRDSNDQIYVPLQPTANGHAASKKFVEDSIGTAMTSVLVYQGTKTVAQINALNTSTLKTGYFYNVSDSGIITLGNIEVVAGDNICWTGSGWDKLTMDLSAYDDKFIAAGFFEVQDYNESTGEITMVYASDLYSMSYSSDTGILTIQAN